MSDDAFGALLMLGLLIVFLPIAIVLWLLWLIAQNADEIAAALVVIGKGIWIAHKAVGYALLWLVRDLAVRILTTDKWSSRSLRAAIITWLVVVPPFLFIAPLVLLAGLFDQVAVLLLMAPSVGAIAYGYYTGYFERPVHHHRWPRFMAELYLMRAEGQLAFIERFASAQFWVAKNSQIVHSLATKKD